MARSRRPKTAIQSEKLGIPGQSIRPKTAPEPGNLGIPEQSRKAGTQTQSRRKRKPIFLKLGTPAE